MIRKISFASLNIHTFLFCLFMVAAVVMASTPGKVKSAASFTASNSSYAAGDMNEIKYRGINENNSRLAIYNDPLHTESAFLTPTEGYGGPVLVISSTANPFSRYTVEILRAEGLNYFAAADISAINTTMLNDYDVIVLGETTVTEHHADLLTKWVYDGGILIAFRPSPLLVDLFGIKQAAGTLKDKYLLIDTASGPGAGLVDQTIQYHGTADLHELNDAISLARLYSSATTATNYPAVTLRNTGRNGGMAVAFTYDLARSIIYTRQGNPRWAGQKRDGEIDPIRSDDLFYPDWIDLNKVAIPQADEQQRLLANIILQSNLHRKPLPRFWYLPRELKATIVMTGDDHAMNKTADRFRQYMEMGPNTPGDVAQWNAVRATSYIYPNTGITDKEAASFEKQGFEIALHPNTNCSNFTFQSLQQTFTRQLAQLSVKLPSIAAPVTNRTHCLAWSDWSSTPKVEVQHGIRLDASYYYWPASWIKNRPGMFTGSGFPMRFADMNGSIIDNYQLVTQMTDESGIDVKKFCDQLLDNALGNEGYYGVFCANMHTDTADHNGSNAIILSAKARSVPVISARQLLTWLDGRNNSFFSHLHWDNNRLMFKIRAHRNARGLKAMLPLYSATGKLVSLSLNGQLISYTTGIIKGMEYAFFPVAAGYHRYIADYNTAPPMTEQIATAKNHNESNWANTFAPKKKSGK